MVWIGKGAWGCTRGAVQFRNDTHVGSVGHERCIGVLKRNCTDQSRHMGEAWVREDVWDCKRSCVGLKRHVENDVGQGG